jgi:hypothetical protein
MTGYGPSPDTPFAIATRVRWRVFGLVMATSGLAFILRTNLSIAGPSIKTELGLSESQLGSSCPRS